MKKLLITALWLTFTSLLPSGVKAQSIADCLEQLALDYQKLASMKSVLTQVYQGYEIVNKGYNSVKDVSKGNFSLHEAFINGLMSASPTVKKYPRVKDIINDQGTLLSEYRAAYGRFKIDPHFSPEEISYLSQVYSNLIGLSVKNLEQLSIAVSDNKVSMSDAERMAMIDQIYTDGHSGLTFLRKFNNQTFAIATQRAGDDGDRQTLQNLYGIH